MLQRYIRTLTAFALCAAIVGPFSMAAAFAQTSASQAASQASGSITGTVKNTNGAPVSGVTVSVTGPQRASTTSDSQGNFTLGNLKPGIYFFTAAKSGFTTATESNITVLAGQAQALAVTMSTPTFTSLRTIANVRSVGRGTFNTTPASVNVTSSQTFELRGAQQVAHVLDAVPGLQISIAGNGVNGASPGGITFANIRGARSYETASLIDGHPLFVGDYGDYVSSFLNSFMFKDVETIKGPGATVPQVNFALGGSVNFETKDPTYLPTADVQLGFGSYGSTYQNFSFSNTFDDRLGVMVAYASNNAASPFNGQKFYFTNYPGFYYPAGGTVLYSQQGNPVLVGGGTSSSPASSQAPSTIAQVACCLPVNGFLNSVSELTKFTYKLSNATTVMASYLGGQARADQFANTGDVQYFTFQPLTSGAPAYTPVAGAPAVGSQIPVVFGYASQFDYETNNEPIFQGEIHTTLGNDTILGRYYHASISRIQYQGPDNPASPEGGAFQVWGNQSGYGSTQKPYAFEGGPYVMQNYEYYRNVENDKLSGDSLQYIHPMGDDSLTFSYDRNVGDSNAYSQSGASGPGATVPGASVTTPQGSQQTITSYMLRGHHVINSKLNATLSLYENQYSTTTNGVSQGGSGCQFNGANCVFQTENTKHFDERMGLEWRPGYDWAVRASAGSSVVPPYLGLLTTTTTALPIATTSTTTSIVLGSYKNPNLLPETGFGYDFGFDHRMPLGITMSFDAYLTNMFNGYFKQLVPTGFTCATPGYCSGTQAGNANVPIFASYNNNLSNARFEGLELEIKRAPERGFGFDLAGSTQRGYAYNLPSCFYSTSPSNCNAYNTNLNVIAGQNFNGGGNFLAVCPPAYTSGGALKTCSGSAKVFATTGISAQNQSIPYFTGNAALNYTFGGGVFAEIGDTFFGKNNSYNEPPFGIAYAALRVPLKNGLAVQVSGDNIFNAYPGLFPVAGTGVPVQLANGGVAATNGNVAGPATYQFTLIFHETGKP